MPRRKTAVKIKSLGAVDIHFHGAFGIDLMRATSTELDALSRRLRAQGVAAFCPTTLSVPFAELRAAVRRLGDWVKARRRQPDPQGAIPLGIHLEGPYLHPGACGAHPPRAIRRFSLKELKTLWEDSSGQLKILTLAPERLSPGELRGLSSWAAARKITLSLGHSRATEAQAALAFSNGFSSVTHGWNALGFHHRAPGALGAALGRPGVAIELILDQVHVSPTLLQWTRKLHGEALCYVSDCVPAAGTPPGSAHRFGSLKIRLKDGASRLPNGELAGGGVLLPRAFARWIETQARKRGVAPQTLLRQELPSLGLEPLKSIGLSHNRARLPKVEWTLYPSGKVSVSPV